MSSISIAKEPWSKSKFNNLPGNCHYLWPPPGSLALPSGCSDLREPARLERANLGDLTDAEGKPDRSQSRPWDFLVGREAVAPGNLSPILTFLTLRQTTKLAWWKFFLSLYPKHTDY